jgi:hypothetical protein
MSEVNWDEQVQVKIVEPTASKITTTGSAATLRDCWADRVSHDRTAIAGDPGSAPAPFVSRTDYQLLAAVDPSAEPVSR